MAAETIDGQWNHEKEENGEVAPPPLPSAFALEPEPPLAAAQGEGGGCFAPKMRGPETLANGELVDAYAMNPPCATIWLTASLLSRKTL